MKEVEMEKRLKIAEELKKELNKKLNEKLDKLEMLEKMLQPSMPANTEIIETREDIERIRFAIRLLEESIDEIDDGFESAKRYAIHVLSSI